MKAIENTPLQTRLLMALDIFSGLGKAEIPDALGGSVKVHRGKLFLLVSQFK